MRSFPLIAAALFLTATALPASSPQTSSSTTNSRYDDEYIVVLSSNNTQPWSEVFAAMGYNRTTRHLSTHSKSNVHSLGTTFSTSHGTNIQTFGTNFRAFTMKMAKTHSVSLASLPGVEFVEKNHRWTKQVPKRASTHSVRNIVHLPWNAPLSSRDIELLEISKRQIATNVTDPLKTELIQQSNAPWSLQRISSQLPISADGRNITELTYKYRFESLAGKNVDIYIIDSGINVNHTDFNGRAKILFSAFGDDGDDEDGHGTHVAGTAASLHFGVAKNSNIWGVKVLDGNGEGGNAGIAAGIDAVLTAHSERKSQPDFAGSVINMSLGSPEDSQTIRAAVQRATEAGIHMAVAPGNDNKDSCTDFPAGYVDTMPSIVTVGATDIDDIRADFSDFGRCVTVHAPGVMIVSTTKDGGTGDKDGTSMASPAVAGVIADLLAQHPEFKLNPLGLKKLLVEKAQRGVIKLKAGDKAPDGGMPRALISTGISGAPL